MKKPPFAGLLCAVLGLVCVLSSAATAATIPVTNANDDGPGSLREAIYLASNGDEIVFDTSLATVPIVLTNGELLIDKDLTITGLGQDQTIVDGGASSRVFRITEPSAVTLALLTIRNGYPRELVPGQDDDEYDDDVISEGGGIYNAGTLSLIDSSIQSNEVSGRVCIPFCRIRGWSVRGGGIFNSGTLSLSRTTVTNNMAESENRTTSSGGGIHNVGQATLVASSVSSNTGTGDKWSGVQGASVFNGPLGNMSLTDTQINGNWGISSPALVNEGEMTFTRCDILGNAGWFGGALKNTGVATIIDSNIGSGWSGVGGVSGGISNSGDLEIVRSTIAHTSTESGGNIYNTGNLRITNSTVSNSDGFRATGGIYNAGSARVLASTITGNYGWGGGIYGGATSVRNSILAGNVNRDQESQDCEAVLLSLGHNVLGTSLRCSRIGDDPESDIVGVDWASIVENSGAPWLIPQPTLSGNGGPTQTVALLPNSPAIDVVPLAYCVDGQGGNLTTDQRGVLRPQGAGCDVGAFEFSLPRAAGFWAHQCSDKGFKQVRPQELQDLFAKAADNSSVFPEFAPANCEFLMPQAPQDDMRARAQQRLLNVWLNLNSGRLTRGRSVDLTGLTSATTVGEALSQLEMSVCDPDATHNDLVNAKDIAEALNGSIEDMELAATESAMALMPGASRTVALGLINLSPGNRNYSLSVSGPWPVRLSTSRINALGSGEVAQVTATITAPLKAQTADGQFRITATDLSTQGTLTREVAIKVRLTGNSTFQPVQKPTKVD